MNRLLVAGAGLAVGRAVLSAVRRSAAADALERTNYRGRTVSLAGGPALAVAASAAGALGAVNAAPGNRGRLAAATLVAGLGAGAVGLYDDVAGIRPEHRAKGFRGHLRALREGRVTTGLVKVVGVSAVSLAAAAALPATRSGPPARRSVMFGPAARRSVVFGPAARRSAARARPSTTSGGAARILDVLLGAGVIAGTANLVNLLDLRPGRALKVSLAASWILDGLGRQGDPNHPRSPKPGAAGAGAGVAGAVGAVIADDLGERVMIGDSGANAIGAVLGVAAAARTGPVGRAVLLAGLAALTAASEKVSFTAVIEATPGLRQLDRLGRRA